MTTLAQGKQSARATLIRGFLHDSGRSLVDILKKIMACTDDNMDEIISKLAFRGYRLEKIGNVDGKKYAALDEKHFRRVDKYDGTEGKWAEWLFNFTVAISTASNSCWVAIEHVIKNGPLERLRQVRWMERLRQKFERSLEENHSGCYAA